MSLLEITDLETTFDTQAGEIVATDGISFELEEGETLGIVGESGSGKSVTALSIMGLIRNPGQVKNGSVRFRDKDLHSLSDRELRKLLGRDISMVFQEASSALNPAYTIGHQIEETLEVNDYKGDPRERAVDLLEQVGIPSPEENLDKYPHQYSGGMAQRAMIAIAISREPQLLIADEPTTALDVTIQAQILELFNDIQEEMNMSMIFISHDMGIIWEVCDRVAVMYKGKIVEIAETEQIFKDPKHPYTRGLLQCLPQVSEQLEPIKGTVPSGATLPGGCTFHPRCEYATDACVEGFPESARVGENHRASCYLYTDHDESGEAPSGKLPQNQNEKPINY
ncbi:ABC transporter ATP-binding protein [Halostagnicola sp. A-GB9-2]|uniref:ABC transporter ATP-binding protein n=1 Tax=Halostagnicola sp. A-GB9-2 TaxID=3048066 RepID=UPI0024C08FA5|nr:ABC transporter ATP-binding protein [Halostagnicola sp. A-GB9-2]MDJ1434278.1 ABC transporter ATP-binding protein [Halostagnicola sp. A-GB9-2]